MRKPQVLVDFLVPADQHEPETKHPTMRAFHHPATGLTTDLLLQRLGFFPPRAAMGRATKLRQQLPHWSVGFLPTFFPPRGFGHGTVHHQPLPVNPLQGIILHETLLP
jgi:hypothetical protein